MATLTLVQGPPGGGKSQHVAELLAAGTVSLVADVTRLWAAIGGYERDPETGRYPIRQDDDPALAIALYTQVVVVRRALSEGSSVAVTASRPNAEAKWERIAAEFDNIQFVATLVDPGVEIVRRRLKGASKAWDRACESAIDAWYHGREHQRP